MIHVERIEKILQVLIATAALKDGRGAVSAQLIAGSDAGKSELLLRNQPKGARVINDMTFGSLVALLDTPTPPKWIVIPDLNQAISHKPAVANLTMAFLLSLLGEGVTEIPGMDGHAKLKNAVRRARGRGLTIALLTAMTPEMFFSKRGKWRETGLLRRLVPIYYTYSKSTMKSIQESIRHGRDGLSYDHVQHRAPKLKAKSVTIANGVGLDLERLSETVTENQFVWSRETSDGRKKVTTALEFPFSVQKTLRAYARAHAILNDRIVVNRKDVDATVDFSAFVRYDRPERI